METDRNPWEEEKDSRSRNVTKLDHSEWHVVRGTDTIAEARLKQKLWYYRTNTVVTDTNGAPVGDGEKEILHVSEDEQGETYYRYGWGPFKPRLVVCSLVAWA